MVAFFFQTHATFKLHLLAVQAVSGIRNADSGQFDDVCLAFQHQPVRVRRRPRKSYCWNVHVGRTGVKDERTLLNSLDCNWTAMSFELALIVQ